MPTDTKLNNLIINYLTQEQYDAIQTPNENELYLTPDNSTGGGGTSPCLNLFDMDTGSVRTSITEEEKTNLEKGLYNSVLYADPSTNGGEYSMYFPENALSVLGEFGFSAYNISVDEASNAVTIPGSSLYAVRIGDKNADGTYPIVIEKQFEATFGGGGSGGSSTPSTSLSFQDITVSELANHVGEIGNFHITDLKAPITFFDETECNGVWFSGSVSTASNLCGELWVKYVATNQYIFLGSGLYQIEGGKIKNGIGSLGGDFSPVGVGAIKTIGGLQTFNSSTGSKMLSTLQTEGKFVFVGNVNKVDGQTSSTVLTFSIPNAFNQSATGEETYCELVGLFAGSGIGSMAMKKDSDGKPQFKSFTTWLPPVTSADEGKSLVIKNGNAQWTDLTSIHNHTIVIKEGTKIIFAANKDLASATPATTVETLISTFKDTTTAGFGDYILLTVDTTAKLTKQDGTETDLSTLNVTISDTVK